MRAVRERAWALHLVALAAVTAAVWLAHVWRLDAVPAALFQDESGIAHSAYMIATTGREEHGAFMPLYFESFGDWKAPVYVYAVAAAFLVATPSVAVLRLVSALFFAVFYASTVSLARRVSGAEAGVVFSAIAAGFLPWIFAPSRIAIEVISQAAFVSLFLLFAHAQISRVRPVLNGALASCALGIALYCYPTSRLIIPLLFFAYETLLIARWRVRDALVMLTGFFVTSLPFFHYMYAHGGRLTSRFMHIGYIHDPALSFWEKIAVFATNYAAHFSPTFLLFAGDANRRHATGFGGEVFSIVALAALVGFGLSIVELARGKRIEWNGLLLALTLLGPAASALTTDGIPHAFRSILLAIPFLAYASAAVGAIARHPFLRKSGIAWVFVLVVAAESALYVRHYFVEYPPVSESAFRSGNHGFDWVMEQVRGR